jgi:AcrR family transcriptional regulator
MTAKPKNLDSRQARSEATKKALMRAAEKLIADRGVENVSISDIVGAANQKNQSALQYHFTNLSGLIDAILASRSEETHQRRAELINELLDDTTAPSLREICTLMVYPAFSLARESSEYHDYVKAFGHELLLSERSLLPIVRRRGGGGASGEKTAELLKTALPHLKRGALSTAHGGSRSPLFCVHVSPSTSATRIQRRSGRTIFTRPSGRHRWTDVRADF